MIRKIIYEDEKEWIIPRTLPVIPYDFNLWSKPLCHTRSNALEMSSAMARESKEKSKALLNRSVITVSTSAVERDARKPYCWSESKLFDSR